MKKFWLVLLKFMFWLGNLEKKIIKWKPRFDHAEKLRHFILEFYSALNCLFPIDLFSILCIQFFLQIFKLPEGHFFMALQTRMFKFSYPILSTQNSVRHAAMFIQIYFKISQSYLEENFLNLDNSFCWMRVQK